MPVSQTLTNVSMQNELDVGFDMTSMHVSAGHKSGLRLLGYSFAANLLAALIILALI